MTNYTKTTDFAAKDALPSGNSAKIVKGSEIDTEFNNIATASATKANKNDAALTGTTTFETISDGTIAITAFVDEDNMASDSATLLPTQQSVKAYVDSQVTAQDLDVTDGSTSIDIDLDSESLGILGGTGIDSTALGTNVTLAIDSTVATLTGSQTLSNKTLSAPVVSGNLTTDGLLDGRDVATDGAKLDGIESGATADQTAAEIKTAYESNADTNAFTDADESKLDGIEASADVTDTANVTAAGALMDSELTSEASVKALNQGVATTDSPTFAGLTTTADVSFGDNDKAIFGAGSDLQIYHDGSGSYVSDTGTGPLRLQGSGVRIVGTGGENLLIATAAAEVTLLHNNSAKLATTSTGIDVTGTAVTDGVTVDGNILLNTEGNELQFKTSSTPVNKIYTDDTYVSNGLTISADNGVTLKSTNNYLVLDDTSTNEMILNVDSGERMRVTSTGIDVTGTVTADGLTVDGNTTNLNYGKTFFTNGIGTNKWQIWNDNGGTDKFQLVDGDGHLVLQAEQSGDISFYNSAGTSQSLFWDSSAESLGIGTTSPAANLEISDTSAAILRLTDSTDSAYSQIRADAGTLQLDANAGNAAVTEYISMRIAGSEAMRIDSSGNLLVGKSSSSFSTAGIELAVGGTAGKVQITRASNQPLSLNRTGNEGSILSLYKDGTTVGSIGVENADRLYIDSGSGNTGIRFDGGAWIPRDSGAVVDDVVDLGATSARFDDIYATNGTIQTSDRNEKQDIEALSDAEQRVAVSAKGLLRKFRWISSVEENGDDARIHFGIIAQDLQAAFEAEGLDAGRYAMFINSTWTDEETGEERSRMGVRYSELLAFIIAAI